MHSSEKTARTRQDDTGRVFSFIAVAVVHVLLLLFLMSFFCGIFLIPTLVGCLGYDSWVHPAIDYP